MKIAFQMEAMESQDGLATSSFYLIQEACQRGYEVYHYLPQDLYMANDGIYAWASPVTVDFSKEKHFELAGYRAVKLDDFDIVWLRQHPPFDMTYITPTYMLEALQAKGVLVTNNPASVRNLTDKFIIFPFDHYIAPTLVGRNIEAIAAFLETHGEIVAKPLYSYSSKGVIRTTSLEEVKAELAHYPEGMMFQTFLPEIKNGKKRILLFDGAVERAVVRVPDEGDFLTPSHVPDLPSELTATEKEMCAEIGAYCKKHGLHFVGLDFIGDRLIEINVTCTGGISNFNNVYKEKFEAKLWDVIERKAKELKAA